MKGGLRARAYIAAVLILGSVSFASLVMVPRFGDLITFGLHLLVVIVCSVMKVRLPGVRGTLSLNFIPIISGIVVLTPTESLIAGLAGSMVQCFWHATKRPKLIHLSFNLAVMAIAVAMSQSLYSFLRQQSFVSTPSAFAALAVAYFVMCTLPVSTAIAVTEGKSILPIWRDCYVTTFTAFMVGAAAAGVYSASTGPKWLVLAVLVPLVYGVYRGYFLFFVKLEKEKEKVTETAELNLRTIEVLVAAMEAKEGIDYSNVKRMQTYAVGIGKELGLSEPQLKALATAAVLRDIGKLAVPDHLLSKPGQLTPSEKAKVQNHSAIGAQILEAVNFPYPVVPLVRGHHEKWDGTGYPDGLKGEAIPLGARVIGLVDALVAMASERPYRPRLPFEEAVANVIAEANTSFDPRIVEILKRRWRDFEKTVDASSEQGLKPGTRPPAQEPAYRMESMDGAAAVIALKSIAVATHEAHMFAASDSFLTLRENLAVFAIRLKRAVPYEGIAIYVHSGGRLTPEFASGEDYKVLSSTEIPVGQGISGKVAETGKSTVNANPADEFRGMGQLRYKGTMGSATSIPLESMTGHRGVLTLYRTGRDAFTSEDLRVLLAVRLRVLDWELQSYASEAMDPQEVV